ncbi:MAG: hypothetical protein Q8O93_00605 [bacterium]|nr:hypothetical protein [bacterium]
MPKFKQKTLIVAAAKQTAKFYVTRRDKIESAGTIKVKTPAYTDREGFFEHAGKQEVYGS